MSATNTDLATAEQALCVTALHGDPCATALVRELERLQRIEAAAIAAHNAEKAWAESGGMSADLASAMCNAQVTLRGLLEKGGAK